MRAPDGISWQTHQHLPHFLFLHVLPNAGMSPTTEMTVHHGGCHCRAVEFEFDAPRELVAIDCNCSICIMKRNTHAIIPAARFRLLKGEDAMTTYTFNTHRAKHMFCQHCGVQPFYIPRSNPDGYAITIHCIDKGTVDKVMIEPFDGENWENAYATSDITKYSKE